MINISETSIVYKFVLAIAVAILFVALILKLGKKMSELENAVFTVVLISTLAISWVSGDIREGKLSIFTVAILIVLLGAIATMVKKFAKHKSHDIQFGLIEIILVRFSSREYGMIVQKFATAITLAMVGMAVMSLAVGDIGAVVYGVGRITGNNQYVQASNDIMIVGGVAMSVGTIATFVGAEGIGQALQVGGAVVFL